MSWRRPGFGVAWAFVAAVLAVFCSHVAAARDSRPGIVLHRKVPRSVLLALDSRKDKQRDDPQQSQPDQSADDLAAIADKQFRLVEMALTETTEVRHNSVEQSDMLQTQLLSNGESISVLSQLAATVKQMKAHVNQLETHEKLCRKRLADAKGEQASMAADTRMANTVADQ
mmetsp:Transcript_13354/g.29370  ORF Transcript_13354/g.29370 Transcript_13354/m.29370 type:complete len:171 (-) Transcript_13354:72-584(-)